MEHDAAARVLQKFLHVLASTLDPVPLATALYSLEVIEERTWEEARAEGASYDRNLKVIGAVRKSVKTKPEYFDKFCSVLEEQAVTKDLAKKLKAELQQEIEDLESSNSDSRCPEAVGNSPRQTKDRLETTNTSEVLKTGKRKQRNDSECDENGGAVKHRTVLREGKIKGDKILMDVAREIGGKWEEVGIALDVDFKVLRSVIASETAKADHMKAFYMLQEWRSRAAERFTYSTLASALESTGLNTCAQEYCYSQES